MAAIYIEYYTGAGCARNLPEGCDVDAELEKAQLEFPYNKCSIIGTQSFGSLPSGGPERDMMPGY